MGESFKFSYKPQRRESLGLAVYNTGFQKCETGHSWGPGVRDHYLIHYIVSGKGAYEFGGKTYHLTTGDAFLVYPNQTAFYTADKTDPWEYYWVGFNGTEAERLLHLTDFSHNSPIIHYGGDEKLRQSLLDIYHAGGSSAANEARMIGKLYLFLSYLIQMSEKENTGEYSNVDYIEKAVKYIQYNYSLNIDVCDIASFVGISRSHLYRLFIKHLKIPPNEYLSKFRINEACSLLRRGQLSIGEIAYSVGFSDQLYFSRVFKKIKGVAPSKYIKTEQTPKMQGPL